jgi:hypothetical protein
MDTTRSSCSVLMMFCMQVADVRCDVDWMWWFTSDGSVCRASYVARLALRVLTSPSCVSVVHPSEAVSHTRRISGVDFALWIINSLVSRGVFQKTPVRFTAGMKYLPVIPTITNHHPSSKIYNRHHGTTLLYHCCFCGLACGLACGLSSESSSI